MNKLMVDDLLRRARPSETAWAASPAGDSVLRSVMRTPRQISDLPKRTAWLRVAAGAAVLAAAAVATTVAVGHQPTAAPVVASASSIDTYRPGDLAFYSKFEYDESKLERGYKGIADATSAASAVVLAKATDVRITRTITEENGDQLHMVGVALQPSEVIRGRLSDSAGRELVVVLGSETNVDRDQLLERYRADLPAGEALWFVNSVSDTVDKRLASLKAQGITPSAEQMAQYEAARPYYSLLSSQGLLVQGPDRVVSPTAHDSSNGLAAEAGRHDKLSAVVEKVRQTP